MSVKPTPITDELYNYLLNNFSSEDEFLSELKTKAVEAGIPDISISPDQGAFLQFMVKAVGARRILEIGSLAGYSAITMARALPANGKLVTVEKEFLHASFMAKKIVEAGLAGKIEIQNTDALEFLKTYRPDFEFDLVFIDADKTGYTSYFEGAARLLRKGGIVIVDNAFAFGELLVDEPDRDKEEILAVRDFNQYLKSREDFQSCLATLGDGMAMGVKLI